MEVLLYIIVTVAIALSAGFLIRKLLLGKLSAAEGKEFPALREGIVYFYSPRCKVCMREEKEIKKLEGEVEVLHVNVEEEEGRKLAREMGVLMVPAFLFVREGRVVKVSAGFVSGEKLLEVWDSLKSQREGVK